MSACPRFPPNRKYGQLRFEQGFEVFEIHPQRYEKLSLYIIYVTLDISMQYEIRLGKFMQWGWLTSVAIIKLKIPKPQV